MKSTSGSISDRGQQTIGPVGVLFEVCRVPSRIAPSMLGEEVAVGLVCPARACSSRVIRSEPGRESPLPDRLPDVLDEPTHLWDRITPHPILCTSARPAVAVVAPMAAAP